MIKANCELCGKEFQMYPCELKVGRRFCSKHCSNSVTSKIRHSEKKFGLGIGGYHPLTEFKKGMVPWDKGLHIKFNNALEKWRVGGGIPWNKIGEGITKENKLLRRKFQQTVQLKVFERDGYTCQLCGAKGNLQVDHIQPWAEYIEGRFDINNCRTLCMSCHYSVTFGRPMPESVMAWGNNQKYFEGRSNL